MSVESDLEEEIQNSQAIIYYGQLESIKLNYFVFKRNFEELRIPLDNMNDLKKGFPLWDVDKRGDLEKIQYEVIRRLFNFLFSSKALVDYTRNSIKEWYKGTDFKKEYDEEISKRFTNNYLVGFIEDLRNYSAHYSLPVSRPRFTISGINTKDFHYQHSFVMSKTILLRWKDWKKGKKFLSNSPEEISIDEFTHDYFKLIDNFESWLYKRIFDLHKEDLEWLSVKNKQLNDLLDKIFNS